MTYNWTFIKIKLNESVSELGYFFDVEESYLEKRDFLYNELQ